MSNRHLCVVLVFVAGWALAGCAAEPGPAPAGPAGGASAAPATRPDEPCIVHWNDGVHLLNIKPSVLFAAWADGRVVRRVPGGPHYTGTVTAAQVEALMEKVEAHRLFDPPLKHGYVVPDGPSETIVAHYKGRSIRLSHDGTFEWRKFDGSPPSADEEAFIRMWARVYSAINDVWPDRMERVKADSPLTQPAR